MSVSKLLEDTNIELADLKRIVLKDEKYRYSFSDDLTEIRANQGHSTEINLELKESILLDIMYHGTADRFLESIFKEGIKK